MQVQEHWISYCIAQETQADEIKVCIWIGTLDGNELDDIQVKETYEWVGKVISHYWQLIKTSNREIRHKKCRYKYECRWKCLDLEGEGETKLDSTITCITTKK